MVKKVQEIRLAPLLRRPRHIYMVKIMKNKTKQRINSRILARKILNMALLLEHG